MAEYLSGHQSTQHASGSAPVLNVNWVICGRGAGALSGLALTHAHMHVSFSSSSSKESNKTFTVRLRPSPLPLRHRLRHPQHTPSARFRTLRSRCSDFRALRRVSGCVRFLSLGSQSDPGLNTLNRRREGLYASTHWRLRDWT